MELLHELNGLLTTGGMTFALLFLRVVVAIIFVDSGRRHLQDPAGRAAGLGLPVWFVWILGIAEVAGGVLFAAGVWVTIVGLLLAAVMFGAIFFKLFVWKTSFYGTHGDGWYYDLLILASTGVVLTSGPGALALGTFFS